MEDNKNKQDDKLEKKTNKKEKNELVREIKINHK